MSNISALSGCRVLMVEDEVLIAKLFRMMLDDLGCTVVGPAARVEQALTMIESPEMFDVVMLDINLNGTKSYPVADVLIARGIPFIFSTGYDHASLPNAYQFFPYLQKPYWQAELGDALLKLYSSIKLVNLHFLQHAPAI